MLWTKCNSEHLRLPIGQGSTKTFLNNTRVARLAQSTPSIRGMNHCGLTPHELPWHTVATDLFYLKNSKYLLLVDYYSRSPVLCKLLSTTSRVLVQSSLHRVGSPRCDSLKWRTTVHIDRVERLHETVAN